jgi:hypothetical protein
MVMEIREIRCESHGVCSAVMACAHVAVAPLDVIYFVPADDEYPDQAWCGACEVARMDDQGWNDAADAVAQWRWLCHGCVSDALGAAGEWVLVEGPESTPE